MSVTALAVTHCARSAPHRIGELVRVLPRCRRVGTRLLRRNGPEPARCHRHARSRIRLRRKMLSHGGGQAAST
eukprot:11686562-Prorocentrum_lima.AAC.1